MKSKRINKKSRKMRSYKRSVKNNKKRTRRSFIKKKRTKINRRTKREGKKILRGGSSQQRNYTMFSGTQGCILMQQRLKELYDSDQFKFAELEQLLKNFVNNIAFNKILSSKAKGVEASLGCQEGILKKILEKINLDYGTNCAFKDLHYGNIGEILFLINEIKKGEKQNKQSWSEWISSLSPSQAWGGGLGPLLLPKPNDNPTQESLVNDQRRAQIFIEPDSEPPVSEPLSGSE